ncbi:MAG: response regulator [Candidatus Omnitrophica bacterium]|nr:response regulator [Candidatus Omnitrophota bacterium]
MAKILVVDDYKDSCEAIQEVLQSDGHEVITALSGEEGLEVFKANKLDVIISDVKMSGISGIEMLGKIKEASTDTDTDTDTDTEVIIMTGYGSVTSAVEALKKGAFDYLTKPINFDELRHIIKRALEARTMRQELKFQQAQLLRAAKLAAVGELGAGVAHEMNQPLMAIASHLELISMNPVLNENPKLKEKMGKIKDQIVRLGTIVKRLHEYAGHRKEGMVRDDPNRPVRDGLYLLGQQLKDHNIELVMDLSEELPQIFIDRYQIQDVVINFLVNARDAVDDQFKEQPGGQIRIVSRKMEGVQAIFVGVLDNGIPIKSGSEANLFEPFFTTKVPGKGTGLGLSVSYKIIQAHGGIIDFSTIKNNRKAFYFVLPIDRRNNLLTSGALPQELSALWESL